tara:strand:- start:813 stop:1202 length:390 start_codon:yes stop_codon:yes gene_type:complete
MAAHEVLDIIDEHKEKLPDGVYKHICELLAKLNKEQWQEPKYASVYGCLLTTHCDDGHYLYDNPVNLLVEVVDPNEVVLEDWGIEKGKVSKEFMADMMISINKRGYVKTSYNRNGDTELIVLKVEMIKP